MKPIKEEPDYLQRLINAKGNIEEHCADLQIDCRSDIGQSIIIALDLLDIEIKHTRFVRRF